MPTASAVRAGIVVAGLCASLTFGLAACSLMDEGDPEPIGEEMFGGDKMARGGRLIERWAAAPGRRCHQCAIDGTKWDIHET